jgi:hypothetical protein
MQEHAFYVRFKAEPCHKPSSTSREKKTAAHADRDGNHVNTMSKPGALPCRGVEIITRATKNPSKRAHYQPRTLHVFIKNHV